jgi:hypothetical protein
MSAFSHHTLSMSSFPSSARSSVKSVTHPCFRRADLLGWKPRVCWAKSSVHSRQYPPGCTHRPTIPSIAAENMCAQCEDLHHLRLPLVLPPNVLSTRVSIEPNNPKTQHSHVDHDLVLNDVYFDLRRGGRPSILVTLPMLPGGSACVGGRSPMRSGVPARFDPYEHPFRH